MLNNTVTCTSGVPNLVVQPKKKTKSKILPHQAETTKQQQQQQTLETKNLALFFYKQTWPNNPLYIPPPSPEPTLPSDINSELFNFQFLTLEFELASSSRRFHTASLFDWFSPSLDSASLNFFMHSSKRFGSWSEKSLRTLRVRLRTAWFQWDRAFRSSAGKMIGRITL